MHTLSAFVLALAALSLGGCSDSSSPAQRQGDQGPALADLGPAPADQGGEDLGPADLGPADLNPADLAPPDLGPEPADLAPPADQGPAVLLPLEIPPGCNPIAADWDCLLPFPSDVFLRADASRPSGQALAIPQEALPLARNGERLDFAALHPSDGASLFPEILVLFPRGLDAANLVFHDQDLSRSQAPSSPTVLLDAESGELVAHFAELDPRTTDPNQQSLILRPLQRLRGGHRYVVALHDLRNRGGYPLQAPEGFRRLRDGQTAQDPALAALAPHYEEAIFPALVAAGLARAELQLAWDFSTRSDADAQGSLRALRSDLLQRLAASPPTVRIERIVEPGDEFIFRRIEGSFEVPLYLDSAEPGGMLLRDEQGQPRAQGRARVPFSVQIPNSAAAAAAAGRPARVVQYGHGFFSGLGEARDPTFRRFAERTGVVLAAVEWWGMSQADMPEVMLALSRHAQAGYAFVERTHQGMANALAFAEVLAGALAQNPACEVEGQPAYDPAQLYFYGTSEGHILGGSYLALSPRIERAVLASGGMGFSLMMMRARPFVGFLMAMSNLFPSPLDQQKFVALSATALDPIDPGTWAPHVLSDTLPGSPPSRKLLLQAGLGDASVANLATQAHARSLGLALLEPTPGPVWGLPGVAGPYDGSALCEWDFGVEPPLPGYLAEPPLRDSPVHPALWAQDTAMDQIDRFLRPDGRIEQVCGEGPCQGVLP